jgi:hypothetical protein
MLVTFKDGASPPNYGEALGQRVRAHKGPSIPSWRLRASVGLTERTKPLSVILVLASRWTETTGLNQLPLPCPIDVAERQDNGLAVLTDPSGLSPSRRKQVPGTE